MSDMKVYVMTQKGTAKHENEDRVLVDNQIVSEGYREATLDSGIIAIADGVGGNNAGAIASDFVVTKLSGNKKISRSDLLEINEQLIALSDKNPEYSNMATTLSGIVMGDSESDIFHIGNTRIYIMQGAYLRQITEDNTTVNWLLKNGKLSESEAQNYDRRNEITACFGGGDNKLADALYYEGDGSIVAAKTIIMTSDGIHEYIDIDSFEELLNEDINYEQKLKNIIATAVENGSPDDKSIAIIERG